MLSRCLITSSNLFIDEIKRDWKLKYLAQEMGAQRKPSPIKTPGLGLILSTPVSKPPACTLGSVQVFRTIFCRICLSSISSAMMRHQPCILIPSAWACAARSHPSPRTFFLHRFPLPYSEPWESNPILALAYSRLRGRMSLFHFQQNVNLCRQLFHSLL